MAEELARDRQYGYNINANLVLHADRSQLPRRDKEPTGEPESLWGRVDKSQMGDRVRRDHIPSEKKKAPIKPASKPILNNEFEGLIYKPLTKESKEAYSLILNLMHSILINHSHETLTSATDETLAIIFDSNLKDLDRKNNIEALLNEQLSLEQFNQLISLSKRINDYGGINI